MTQARWPATDWDDGLGLSWIACWEEAVCACVPVSSRINSWRKRGRLDAAEGKGRQARHVSLHKLRRTTSTHKVGVLMLV